jgi:hypothetical protein
MSQRARAYLMIAGTRAILTAVVLAVMGDRADLVYPYVMNPLPEISWIIIWTIIGIVLIIAAGTRSQKTAIWGLIAIATVTAVWAMGISLVFIREPITGTISALLWCALVAKDFIQVRQPLSSPFEDLLKTYES